MKATEIRPAVTPQLERLDEVGRGYLLEPCDAHAVERLGDGDVWLIAVFAPAPYPDA